MKHLLLTTIAAVMLVLECKTARSFQAWQPKEGVQRTIMLDNGTNLSLKETDNHRGLPHGYFDQGMESIPLIHPDHRILVKRRFGQLGQTVYSLIVFIETPKSDDVDISGVAIANQKAWVYHAKTDSGAMATTLQLVNEKLSQLSEL